MRLLCDLERLDPVYIGPDRLLALPQLYGPLRVQPELRRVAEQTGETEGHLRTQGAALTQELIDRLPGDVERGGQAAAQLAYVVLEIARGCVRSSKLLGGRLILLHNRLPRRDLEKVPAESRPR